MSADLLALADEWEVKADAIEDADEVSPEKYGEADGLRDCAEQLRKHRAADTDTGAPEPGMPAIVYADEACEAWMEQIRAMRTYNVTVVLTDGTRVDAQIAGATRETPDRFPALVAFKGHNVIEPFSLDAPDLVLSCEDFTSLVVH